MIDVCVCICGICVCVYLCVCVCVCVCVYVDVISRGVGDGIQGRAEEQAQDCLCALSGSS